MKLYVAWCRPDHDWDKVGTVLGVYTTAVECQKHIDAWDKDNGTVVPLELKTRYTKEEGED